MRIQVLVATMHQTDYRLLEKMNIQTSAIVCNQTDRYEAELFDFHGQKIHWFSFGERGVGLNRNNALMRATEDIVLFADDDVVYCDGYEDLIAQYYKSNPQADVVIFNFQMKRGGTDYYDRVTKEGRVRRKDATKYGTYCISARRESLRLANVLFHLDFGGGTTYSCGEDSLFLQECLKKGLKIYSTKTIIGILDHGQSTWFKGYDDKFFFDKGVLFYMIDKRFASAFSLYHCCKHREKYREYGWFHAWKQMMQGIRYIKKKM